MPNICQALLEDLEIIEPDADLDKNKEANVMAPHKKKHGISKKILSI